MTPKPRKCHAAEKKTVLLTCYAQNHLEEAMNSKCLLEIHNWPSCGHAHHWILGNLASTMTSMRACERLDTLQSWQKRIWCSWPPLRTRFGWDGWLSGSLGYSTVASIKCIMGNQRSFLVPLIGGIGTILFIQLAIYKWYISGSRNSYWGKGMRLWPLQIMSASWKSAFWALVGLMVKPWCRLFFGGRRDLSVWRRLMTDRNSDKPTEGTSKYANRLASWCSDVMVVCRIFLLS